MVKKLLRSVGHILGLGRPTKTVPPKSIEQQIMEGLQRIACNRAIYPVHIYAGAVFRELGLTYDSSVLGTSKVVGAANTIHERGLAQEEIKHYFDIFKQYADRYLAYREEQHSRMRSF